MGQCLSAAFVYGVLGKGHLQCVERRYVAGKAILDLLDMGAAALYIVLNVPLVIGADSYGGAETANAGVHTKAGNV